MLFRTDTHPLQDPINIRRQHNGGPDFIGELALLIDTDLVALQSEADGRGQTADSGANDNDVQWRRLVALSHCANCLPRSLASLEGSVLS
jgi:hypothetical protein